MIYVQHVLWLHGLLAILAAPLPAAELTGSVVGISGGDTLTLLVPDGAGFKQVKVWLDDIDTPELNYRVSLLSTTGERSKVEETTISGPLSSSFSSSGVISCQTSSRPFTKPSIQPYVIQVIW